MTPGSNSDSNERLTRAQLALTGLAMGDAIGGGITAMHVGANGILPNWKQSCEPIPQWIYDELPSLDD